MTDLKIMPHNTEFEESVIWSVLIDNDIMWDLHNSIKPDYFYSDRCRIVWTTILRLYEVWKAIEIPVLADELRKRNVKWSKDETLLDLVWWEFWLCEIAWSTPTSSNYETYARNVKENYVRRNIIKHWHWLADIWHDEAKELDSIIEIAKKQTLKLSSQSIKLKAKTWDELLEIQRNALGEKRELEKQWKSYTLTSKLWLKLERWSHTVIWALPSHWKSTLMLNLLLDFAEQGYKVLYVNIEMTEVQVMNRVYAYLTWKNSVIFKDMDKDNIEDLIKDWEQLFWNFSSNFHMLTNWTICSDDVTSLVSEIKLSDWIDVHWVDYIWILKEDERTKVEQMTRASNTLRAVCKDFNTVWIVATQFSKEWYRVKVPSFAYVKDSQTIFDDADLAIVLHRKIHKKEDMSFEWEHTHDLIIEKNRSWDIWVNKLSFSFNTLRFSTCDF